MNITCVYVTTLKSYLSQYNKNGRKDAIFQR